MSGVRVNLDVDPVQKYIVFNTVFNISFYKLFFYQSLNVPNFTYIQRAIEKSTHEKSLISDESEIVNQASELKCY